MRGYKRGLDQKRNGNSYDIHKLNLIDKLIEDGENPLHYKPCSPEDVVAITHKDVFDYCRVYGKPFSIIISGGKKNGQLRKRDEKEHSKSDRSKKKARVLRN